MEKIYGMHKLVGLPLDWSRTPTFSSGTPTFCQMGVLNSCFQNPSESSGSSNIQSVSTVKLVYSIFMSIDTSMTSSNSHCVSCCIQLVQQMIYAFTKAKNNSFSSILSIYDNL